MLKMKSPRVVGALAPLLLQVASLLLVLTSADAAVPITVGIVNDAASCTAMKLIASNMAVACSGSTDGCHAGDNATITGDRKFL